MCLKKRSICIPLIAIFFWWVKRKERRKVDTVCKRAQ